MILSSRGLDLLQVGYSGVVTKIHQADKEKLDETNFIEWFRFLRAVLRHEKKFYVLEKTPPNAPVNNAPTEVRTAYDKYQDDSLIVGCLMLATMTPELLRDHENMTAWDMISSLKYMFRLQIEQERFDTVKALCACKMTERSSVSTHILKMKGYSDQLTRLGSPLGQELEIDMVLNSLTITYKQFIKDYNMKDKGRGEIPEVAVWYNCFHHRHQMRTCPARLEEIKKQKANRARPSGLARTKVLLTHPGEFLRKDFLSRITNGDTVDLEGIQEPQRWDEWLTLTFNKMLSFNKLLKIINEIQNNRRTDY
ncbi:hypothetical protein L6452_43808 [Arctium lappa]|uniref:Uncharacterized protein n=1 Tax=Arctium lappa TaxID=4217 RepID=A0ACB8XHX6_ARCLA|nr:hypothetical protein L6452_43808 [Arctium lappa]